MKNSILLPSNMKNLILFLIFISFSALAQEETFKISYARMGTNIGEASGTVTLKSDSLLSTLLVGTEEVNLMETTLTKNKIFYLNEYWYKSKNESVYIALYRNPKLYKIGIYNPIHQTVWWIE